MAIFASFARYIPQFFFGGGDTPEFLEWGYKIQPDSDHVAKFQGHRTSENAWRKKDIHNGN